MEPWLSHHPACGLARRTHTHTRGPRRRQSSSKQSSHCRTKKSPVDSQGIARGQSGLCIIFKNKSWEYRICMVTEILSSPRMLKGKSPRKGNERFLVGHHHSYRMACTLSLPSSSFFLLFLLLPCFFLVPNFFFLSSFYSSLDSSLLAFIRLSLSRLSAPSHSSLYPYSIRSIRRHPAN